MLRITFDCTHTQVFSFRNKKINKKSYDVIHEQLNPSQIDFIERINIVYKKYNKSTAKKFEVLVDYIDEEQFVSFIGKMKEVGFTSNNGCYVNCRDEKGDFIYCYDFNSSIMLSPPTRKKKYINWNYKTQNLYKK